MPQTILVDDDDTANRVTLERILLREGFVVEHAASTTCPPRLQVRQAPHALAFVPVFHVPPLPPVHAAQALPLRP